MPNRYVHVMTSGTAGALYALSRSAGEPEPARLCEVFGGIVGGFVGGRTPDVLDPPRSARHRGRAHSLAAGASMIKLGRRELDKWQQTCRRWADGFASKAAACAPESPMCIVFALASMACRILAGLIAGFLAGYITHLTLDACPPSCINVV